MLAGILPAAISIVQLTPVKDEVERIERLSAASRSAHGVLDVVSDSLRNLTASSFAVPPELRARVLQKNDQGLDRLEESVKTLRQASSNLLTPDDEAILLGTVDDIQHSWEEIRKRSGPELSESEKNFHVLKALSAFDRARQILTSTRYAAEDAAAAAVAQSFNRIENTAVLLASVLGATSLASIIAILVNFQYGRNIRQSKECLDAAVSNISSAFCMFDSDQRLVICNRAYGDIYSVPPEMLKPGTRFRDILQSQLAAGIYAGGSPDEYIRERLEWVTAPEACSKIQQLNDGRTLSITHKPIEQGGWVDTHTDITEIQETEQRLAHLAHHDALTDLPNRRRIRERIEELLLLSRKGTKFAVLCIDLDRFKPINDAFGHQLGDELLKSVARRLRECVPKADTVGRMGGDEFVVVQESENQPHDASVLAAWICEVLGEPFDFEGQKMVVGATVGIATAPVHGNEPEKLLRNADLAMYRAKSDGRGSFCVFAPEMDAFVQSRRELEVELRQALELGRFELYYQPLVNLKANQISGFEALLRWNHPQRGLIGPAEFITVAEEAGLIVPISEWVIRNACNQAALWPNKVRVAVNLSALQFRSDNLVPLVFSAIANSGIAAERLELEITETILLQDNELVLSQLRRLREIGVRISMDDFGTGYSSLSYLRSFPFDKIKLDKSFISDLNKDDDSAAIVNAVASISRSLGMMCTAEGVETEEQRLLVERAGYTEIQGYLFSRPMSAKEITKRYFDSKAAKAGAAMCA
jgi:diguanylate cyclase (GGDEF)-like protein